MAKSGQSQRTRTKALREVCHRLGLKLTHQRLEIFNILASAEDHPSAEEVYERVRPRLPTISFDTVYRTLALFERHGVIAKVYHLDDRTRYDPNMARHCHLVCTSCRRITDFLWPGVDRLPIPGETEGWGTMEHRYLELRGICRDCLRARSETAPQQHIGEATQSLK